MRPYQFSMIASASLLLAGCAPGLPELAGAQPLPENVTNVPFAPDEPDLVSLTRALDELAATEMATEHIPGMAVVIVRSGRTVLKRGYGVADVATGRAVDPDETLFRIGSITKALTALAVTRAAADGRVDLNADVSGFIGGIRNPVGSEEAVRVRDLISHSSGFDQIGLGRQVQEWDRPLAERKALRPSLEQFLEAGNLRRVTPPGQLFRYDTYGITLAGAVLHRVTGLPYAQAMRQELFAPLGMSKSFVEADNGHLGQLALGYGYEDGKYIAQPYEVYVTTPASSIDATPADMGRLLEALTSNGANDYGRLFDEKTLGEVLQPSFRPQPHCPGTTHGFFEGPINSPNGPQKPRSIGHGGNMLGFSSLLTIVPDAQLGIFVTVNRDTEAGGGRVRIDRQVTDLIVERLGGAHIGAGPDLRIAAAAADYSRFSGNYVYGVYCRTCTAAERERGGWSPGKPKAVQAFDRGVRIDAETYLATTKEGVFLREDGERHACFGTDPDGRISHFNFSIDQNTFERTE